MKQEATPTRPEIGADGDPESAPSLRSTVSVVILNWNGQQPLLRTISALKRSSYPLLNLILVDNGSTDGSVEAVRRLHADVEILRQEKNLGASEGRNVGIRHALVMKPTYIFNIDNDIEVDRATIAQLVHVADNEPIAGIVGPLMYFKDDPQRIQNVGARICYRQNVHLPIGWRELDRGQYNQLLKVDMVGSGAMLTRAEVFQNAGYFDGGYLGCQLDDTDFCMKARKHGWAIICNPNAKILHDFHFSHKYTFRRKYLESHNAVLFLRKYGSRQDWLKFLFFAVFGTFFAALRELPKGNLRGVKGKALGLIHSLSGQEGKALEVFHASD